MHVRLLATVLAVVLLSACGFDPDEPSRAVIYTHVQSGRILYAIGGAVLVLDSSCEPSPAQ